MSERDNHIELIMAIAEGALAPDEAAAAERALDDAGRAELAAQRAALAALSSVDVPIMSDAERHALRSAVRDEIRIDQPVPAPRAVVRPPWYARMLPVLGGVALLVVVVGVGLSVSRNSTPATFSEIGSQLSDRGAIANADTAERAAPLAAQPAETTAAAAEAAGAEEAPAAADAAGDDGGAEMTLAPPADFTRPLEPVELGDLSMDDPDGIRVAIDGAITQNRSLFPYSIGSLPDAAFAQQCWGEVYGAVDEAIVLLTANATIDGTPGEVYVLDTGTQATVLLYELDTCELIAEIDLEP